MALALADFQYENLNFNFFTLQVGAVPLLCASCRLCAARLFCRGGDNPYLSPEGHHLLDVRFYEGLKLVGEDEKYENIIQEISAVPGVVTHGLMFGLATAAVIASREGTKVLELEKAQETA